MKTANQVAADYFKTRARQHQAKFREEKMNLKEFIFEGHILTDKDALEGKNFYPFPGLFDEIKKRYAQEENGIVPPVYTNMMCPVTIAWNIFYPIKHSVVLRKMMVEILNKSMNDVIEEILNIEIDYKITADVKKTCYPDCSYDALIEYKHVDGSKGIIGFLIQYAENDYSYIPEGTKEYVCDYCCVFEHTGIFDNACLGSVNARKFLHLSKMQIDLELLAASSEETKNHATLILVHPADNEYQDKLSIAYSQLIKNEIKEEKFKIIIYENFISEGFYIENNSEQEEHNSSNEFLKYISGRYTLTKYPSSIDYDSDFITFGEQVNENFGDELYYFTNVLFRRALMEDSKGLFQSALSYANTALVVSNYTNDHDIKYLKIYILHFITNLLIESGDYKEALKYWKKIKFLLENEEFSEELVLALEKLREDFEGEEWKGVG